MRRFLSIVVLVSAIAVLSAGVCYAQDTFFDDLKGTINPSVWATSTPYAYGSVTPTTDGVVLTLLQQVIPRNPSVSFSQWLSFTCQVAGNFDAQYSYELLYWPVQNGIRLGLGAGGMGSPAAVERISGDWLVIGGAREVYLTHFPNGIRGIVDTTDRTGRFRLTRTGSVLRGYYLQQDGTWQLLNTSSVSVANPTNFGLSLWGHWRTPGVTVRLTNFSMTADSIACPVTPVSIDVHPGSTVNPINVRSKGVTPVAVLTTADFDASTVDPSSVTFGPAGATDAHGTGHLEDVDGDGDLDLVFHFYTDLAGIECGQAEATLTGATLDGQAIEGSDVIVTRGCK